jgi:hypothetical protein
VLNTSGLSVIGPKAFYIHQYHVLVMKHKKAASLCMIRYGSHLPVMVARSIPCRHISSMWKLSGLRYEFPDLLVEDAAGLLPNKAIEKPLKPIIWSGQVNEGERHLNQHLFLLEM